MQIVLEELAEKFPEETVEVLGDSLECISIGYSPEILVVFDYIWWSKNTKLSQLKNEIYNLLKESIEKYEGEGVVHDEAVMLALIELYWCEEVKKLNYQGDIREYQVDHYCDYKINSNGNVIGLYLSAHSDMLYLFSIIDNIDRLEHLEELTLSGCSMEAIPESILNLSRLKLINFRYNKIETLPNFIGRLSNLIYLDLSINKIQKIPKSIGCLKKLKIIWLYDNEIETLPEEIGELTLLEDLGLEIYKLNEIPKSITNLGSLKQLDFFLTKVEDLQKKL